MPTSLEQLLDDGIIDEVLGRLKSGKEADVWLVRHHEDVLAAKVYKERDFRSFKNNAAYKEGRKVRNTRTQRAMDRGSKFGRASAEDAWKAAESDALYKLHAAGVRVPVPVLFYEGILLMQLILDPEGNAAPRLIDTAFTPEEANAVYTDLRAQAVKMLTCDLIHGDLSPFNVLLGAEGPTIIDFPQVISAAHNSQSETFFRRDLENLRVFFAGFDPTLNARSGDASGIWRAYVRRDLSPDFIPPERVEPPPPEPRQAQGRRQQERPQRSFQDRPGHGRPQQQGRPGTGGGRTQPHSQPHSQPPSPSPSRPPSHSRPPPPSPSHSRPPSPSRPPPPPPSRWGNQPSQQLPQHQGRPRDPGLRPEQRHPQRQDPRQNGPVVERIHRPPRSGPPLHERGPVGAKPPNH